MPDISFHHVFSLEPPILHSSGESHWITFSLREVHRGKWQEVTLYFPSRAAAEVALSVFRSARPYDGELYDSETILEETRMEAEAP